VLEGRYPTVMTPGLAACCGILQQKQYNVPPARVAPHGTGQGVNAALVLNERCVIFLTRVNKTDFIIATATVMKQHLLIKSSCAIKDKLRL